MTDSSNFHSSATCRVQTGSLFFNQAVQQTPAPWTVDQASNRAIRTHGFSFRTLLVTEMRPRSSAKPLGSSTVIRVEQRTSDTSSSSSAVWRFREICLIEQMQSLSFPFCTAAKEEKSALLVTEKALSVKADGGSQEVDSSSKLPKACTQTKNNVKCYS